MMTSKWFDQQLMKMNEAELEIFIGYLKLRRLMLIRGEVKPGKRRNDHGNKKTQKA